MKGVIITWLIAEGIISWRAVKVNHSPPMPGMLLATSGLFIMLAVLAEAPGAAGLATGIGAGLDIAGFMHLFGLGGPAAPGSKTAGRQATGTTQAPGTTTAAGRG